MDNQDLVGKIVLLAVTALITGLGVPYILKVIDERKLRGQKRFEADLARQTKLIEAQAAFLENLSRILWGWRYLAKKVCYYAAEQRQEHFDQARRDYEAKVWDVLHELRMEISRSRRLVAAEKAYEDLQRLYDYIVGDIDREVSNLSGLNSLTETQVEKARHLSTRFTAEVTEKFDDILDRLAAELKLKVRQ